MTELEKMQRAKMYIDKLANGINPIDDMPAPDDDIINNVRLSRCLFYVSGILQQVIDNEGLVGKRSRKDQNKAPFSLNLEQRERFAYSDIPLPISKIVEQINSLVDLNIMNKLQSTAPPAWLVESGFLFIETRLGRKQKLPTPSGEQIGISTEVRRSLNGPYTAVLYGEEAQHFIIDNLDAITEVNNRPKGTNKIETDEQA